ncbi:MAG: class I SAM-dependent methyltransferase [Betaproteobacteria bacterium]|nr:class I SAM-dependent methyltransferase [Gammaproteobacteria bacterium]MDH3436654.1 class I SAM-dependent methyltransferase [Betaproteobacteria bacterium]
MIHAIQLFAAFDEARYLAANRDVAESIEKGGFFSGWHHFTRSGYRENRHGVAQQLVRMLCDISSAGASEPLPPERLRVRVHGAGDLPSFEDVGRILSCDVLRALAIEGRELPPGSRILDFGCGCGRVFRYLTQIFPGREFVGTDIDGEAIAWSSNHLSHLGTFMVNGKWPPLDFPDETFDLVYAISTFTHLPEKMQFAWLMELQRITRKGGYLILSVHGAGVLETVPVQCHPVAEQERGTVGPRMWKPLRRLGSIVMQRLSLAKGARDAHRFSRDGFLYLAGKKTSGLPNFYQSAYHSQRYIHDQWGRFFEIRRIVNKGIGNYQDLVLCRRKD